MHSDCDCRAPIVGSVLFQIPHWKYLVDPDWKGTAKGCSEYAGSQQAEWKNETGISPSFRDCDTGRKAFEGYGDVTIRSSTIGSATGRDRDHRRTDGNTGCGTDAYR